MQTEAPLGTVWQLRTDFHPQYSVHDIWEMIGLIPYWLDPADPAPADDQLEAHCGCWDPLPGFTLRHNGLHADYPGDPVMAPLAVCEFREGVRVLVYDCGWVGILDESKDGVERFECARLD